MTIIFTSIKMSFLISHASRTHGSMARGKAQLLLCNKLCFGLSWVRVIVQFPLSHTNRK